MNLPPTISPEHCDRYWDDADWIPPWYILDLWCQNNERCRQAKQQALLSACERGVVDYRRSDCKTFDDPVHELAARGLLMIGRGRLTLNILLSFAQFERELGGERVRDKIAASRAKGIWMGGMPPLGYDVVERKLVPNVTEAALVRRIFARYLALGSVTTLCRELRAEGVTTKSWTTLKDKSRAGKLIDKGYLYKLFQNPVFIGIAAYKGQHFTGEHEAILDRAVWEQVQAMLGRGEPEERARQNRPSRAPALLKGLIFADDGWAMTPGATHKGDKVYRYYVNTASMKIGREACSVARVPAGEIEAAVIAQVRKVLLAPEVMSQAIREVVALDPVADAQEVITTMQSIEPVWDELFPAEQARIIQLLVERVTVSPTGLRIDMKTAGMKELIQSVMPPRKAA